MDIQRKVEIAEQAIRSITTHDDEDSVVRLSAIKHLTKFIEKEATDITTRAELKVVDFSKPRIDRGIMPSGRGSGQVN